MKRSLAFFSILVCAVAPSAAQANTASAAKQKAVASIESQSADMSELSDQVWAFCEIPGSASYSPMMPMIGRPFP